MSKERRLVPELRFPEFDNEWNSSKIKKRFDFLANNSFSRAELDNEGVILNIHYGDIHTKYKSLLSVKDDVKSYIKQDKETTRIGSILVDGDVVLADASEDFEGVGKSCELINVNKPIVSGLHTIVLRNKDKQFALGFLGYLFNSKNHHQRLVKLSVGSKVSSISKATLRDFIIYYPNKEEQQKIATFLSLIDKKIELLEKKVKLLEEHKRGLLQKVFSQEIRFKKDDGSEFEEWKIKRLEDVAIIEKGKQLSKIDMIESGKYYVLNGGKSLSGFTNKYNAFENTISISEGGESCGFVSYNNDKFWAGGHLYVLKNLNINVGFLYQYLKFEESKIMRLRVGSGLPNIQRGPLAAYRIYEPSLLEQLKISEFLSIYDSVVDYTKCELRKINEFKKGLLQKMFI